MYELTTCMDIKCSRGIWKLKATFTSTPILIHNNPHKPFTLEADATHFPRASLLLQTKDNGQLHPLTFHS